MLKSNNSPENSPYNVKKPTNTLQVSRKKQGDSPGSASKKRNNVSASYKNKSKKSNMD